MVPRFLGIYFLPVTRLLFYFIMNFIIIIVIPLMSIVIIISFTFFNYHGLLTCLIIQQIGQKKRKKDSKWPELDSFSTSFFCWCVQQSPVQQGPASVPNGGCLHGSLLGRY